MRTKPQIDCGVAEHDEDCLCDVIITNPTETVLSIPHDLKFGTYIADKMDWSPPFTSESLADFMTAYLDTFDRIAHGLSLEHKMQNGVLARKDDGTYVVLQGGTSTIPAEVFDYVKELLKTGMKSGKAAVTASDKFGVYVCKSSVFKLRDRMIDCGEYVPS